MLGSDSEPCARVGIPGIAATYFSNINLTKKNPPLGGGYSYKNTTRPRLGSNNILLKNYFS
ncbi:hypothetical protein COY90_00935 [Candidatus Roizmanbacteria bacterium CG_4_10_14_0_8_um_filter_39_9]|uniref:Uncharacterized protein n=1 Tax=Candidatus Roizmanbacteria bacterium CG_4_10_14_0_8_um_filter_39_9 TaxID=1974829 RepID=A0A2M7QDT7_9BACT|nr:MAG: hypothetical protein COY90_00935 [Candidatus Roizmanbacteria bacterium CG_4_10_14_0_8_um_filter_39_9]